MGSLETLGTTTRPIKRVNCLGSFLSYIQVKIQWHCSSILLDKVAGANCKKGGALQSVNFKSWYYVLNILQHYLVSRIWMSTWADDRQSISVWQLISFCKLLCEKRKRQLPFQSSNKSFKKWSAKNFNCVSVLKMVSHLLSTHCFLHLPFY
jgi:hypothetical protein